VFADGALSSKTKELLAFAIAHVTQSETCCHNHMRRAFLCGATDAELIEAMWVAIVMRAAGGLNGDGARAENGLLEAGQRAEAFKRSGSYSALSSEPPPLAPSA
jgi:AhpD family alkylhydroperoxidase